jgi:2,3-bisphosphoglycerate-dependent phosphoglycerate mutase
MVPRPASPIDRAFLTDDPEAGMLVLVRHGQQEWPDPSTAGAGEWVDPPLSELGRRQAAAVGEYLAADKVEAVYSSALLRAHHTALAVATHHGHQVDVIAELAEIEVFRDLPPDERATDILGERALDGIRERFIQTRRWDAYPYSETSSDFRRRIGYAVESVVVTHPGQTIVIACHGGVINAYLCEILGIAADMVFRPAHASVHRIRYAHGRRVLESLNETRFLGDGLLSY